MKYYGMKEAEARTGLSAYTLRYYDKMGLLPFVERSKSGLRRFKEEDFEWLELINCLKDTGMRLEDIRTFIEYSMKGDETLEQRLLMFQERRQIVCRQIEKLQHTLTCLDYKIQNYEDAYKLIFEYIETFYNTVRIHSHCNYQSPNQYEKSYVKSN